MFNVPTVVLALLAAMAVVHGLRVFLPQGDSDWLTLALAFIPARYGSSAAELPGGEVAAVTSFVTHMLVHGDLTHLAINSAWLLAFGGAVANRIGAWRFLALSAVTGSAGPDGGTAEKPVGLVHLAASQLGAPTLHREIRLGDIGRTAIRIETVGAALNLIEHRLLSEPKARPE